MECTVDGCKKTACAKGLCMAHYRRARDGKPMNTPLRPPNGSCLTYAKSLLDTDEAECILWPFKETYYPKIVVEGKRMLVSRFVCQQKRGYPRPGDEAAHSCGNGHLGCVNPNHLRWATHEENEDDKKLHGTLIYGAKHKLAKLSDEQVIEIRRFLKSGAVKARLADRYGVSRSLIAHIAAGQTWKHLLS